MCKDNKCVFGVNLSFDEMRRKIMKSKILATVAYNIVLWGVIVFCNIIFPLDMSPAAFFYILFA